MPQFNTREEYEAWKAQRARDVSGTPAPGHDFYAAPTQPGEATRAMLCHLASLAVFVVPLGNVLGPWLAWSLWRGSSRFVSVHGEEAFKFQVCVTGVSLVSMLLAVPLALFAKELAAVLMLVVLFSLVYGILAPLFAAFRAWTGAHFRYPFVYRY